jgi:hypothetical protein
MQLIIYARICGFRHDQPAMHRRIGGFYRPAADVVNGFPILLSGSGVLRMDMMSMVSGILAMQAGSTQSQIGATIMKSNADTEKSAVLTLLGAAQQSSQANLAAGVGGSLDIAA